MGVMDSRSFDYRSDVMVSKLYRYADATDDEVIRLNLAEEPESSKWHSDHRVALLKLTDTYTIVTGIGMRGENDMFYILERGKPSWD
jgi:hypothetical protein